MNEKRIISDAPESNAGDDFHVLWSIRKSLELLNTDASALKAITVEGVLPEETKKLDPTGFLFLGVDITEYFGGENFQDANNVVFSQLKYSTRNASSNWTINSISKAYKSKKDPFSGSIIYRLACVFTAYINVYDKDIVLKKIRLKLVSNRNVAEEVKLLIKDVQNFLCSHESTTLSKLKSQFPNHVQGIDLLYKASKLEANDFIDFLKVLDFSDCGVGSRFEQKRKSIEAIAQVAGFSGSQFAELNVFVRNKMMPENKTNNLITEKDVLSIFGFGQVKDLFPAPSQIEKCENYIERESFIKLRDQIINGSKNKYYLHAGAGYGKSTFVSHLTSSLPEGSVSILFDCYGGGTYSDPSDRRHKHGWGILQIANEMAYKIGTPFLLMQKGVPEQYLRELKNRLQQAVKILKVQNPKAILLLIIDAADNSLTAANAVNERSFVPDLIEETLPDDCKLLITTRTSRIKLFDFPSNEFVPLQLNAFNRDETSLYIKKIRHEILSEEFIDDFHQLTHGIPRVQSYALRTQNVALEEILNPLRTDGKNLNDIFADQIKIALKRLGTKEEANTLLKYLANLPRPIPLSTLSLISGIKKETTIDFIVDLSPGLIISNEQVLFKDEDFETYLKDTYLFLEQDYQITVDHMLKAADENEYCCYNLAHFLLKSGNAEKLQQIVLEQTHMSAISEPLQQKHLIIDRTRLALASANKATDKATFIRLQLLAAETAKTNETLRSLFINNADLVVLYDITESNKENYSFDHSWYGAYYARKVAALSRKPHFLNQAKAYLKEAESWFRWCLRQTKNDRFNRHLHISVEDIKNTTEAHLNIFGLDDAIEYISSWRPRKVVFQSIKELTYSLLDQKREDIIFQVLERNDIPFAIELLFIQCLLEYGIIPNDIKIEKIVNAIFAYKGKFNNITKELLINFCELLALLKYDTKTIFSLLQLVNDSVPEFLPRFYQIQDDNENVILFDISCRAKLLISVLSGTEVTNDVFLPTTVKEKLKLKEYDERGYAEDQKREYNRLYGFALPYYKLRIQTILCLISQDEFKSKYDAIIRRTGSDWELKHYHHDIIGLFDFIACRFLDVINFVSDKELLLDKIHNTFLKSNDSKKTNILITTADRISKINSYEIHKLALKYCNCADEIIREDLLTLEDINSIYIKLTRALNRIDPSFGRHFFLKAIEAVDKIDENAYSQIRAIHSLSKIGLPQPSPELAFEFGRFVEYTKTILSGYEHFPMKEALDGIANLNSSSSLAFLCRWDHRKIIEIDDYAGKLFDKLHEKNFIDGVYNAALWTLSPYFYFDSPFLETLEKKLIDFTRQNFIDEKKRFVIDLIRDIKLESHINWRRSYLSQLKDVLQRNSVDDEILSDLDDYIQKINTLTPKEDLHSPSFKQSAENEFDWESLTKDIDYLKLEDLEAFIQKFRAEEENLVYRNYDDFIIYLSNKCSLSQQVSFIEIVCEISPSLLGYYNFESILKKLLKEWKDNPLIAIWCNSNFEKVFIAWVPYILEKYSDSLVYYIRELAALFGVKDEELAPIVTKALPDIVVNLTSEQLYGLIKITSVELSKEDNEIIIRETLNKWNQQIKEDFGDGNFSEELIPAQSSDESLAFVFRYVLGHPDRQMRWKGAQALRRLVNYSPEQSVLWFLIKKQNDKTCYPFQNKDYTFFWMSSKLYLWMTINRISNENPYNLQSIVQEIVNEAIIPSQSHLLIQLFVRRTCSILCQAGMVENSKYILREIEKPFINHVRDTLPEIIIDKDNWKFDFDHTDTIPYWYDGLGRFFNLSGLEIAILAQDIICNIWRFNGDVREKNHVHAPNNKWHLTSNDHGSVPQIETLQTYYEFHAMFCVAWQLLKSKELQNEAWQTFEEWLASYATVWEDKWLSDLRDPEPLLPILHPIDNHSDNWNTFLDWKEYEDYIGFHKDNFLTTNSSLSKYYWKDYETIHVESAFVSIDKAQSLVRTLNDYENYRWYAIPLEEKPEHSINENGFVLKGFHDIIKAFDGEMDDRDTFANGISKFAITPGILIRKHFDLKISDDFRYSYTPNSTEPITIFENWNDCLERDSTENRSSGYHFMIDKKSLIEVLQKHNFCLLIECAVNRKKEKSNSKEKNKYSEFVSLYLLYPDGKIESTSRYPKIREDNY